MLLNTKDIPQITEALLSGKIGVLPTDTIYGVHCLAKDPSLVSRIIDLKGKPTNMPLITLISDVQELSSFDISLDAFAQNQISRFWPGPNTLIFETSQGETKSFRFPKDDFMLQILRKTGPLVSTSANLHKQPASISVLQAQEYFGDKIDFYVDGGVINNAASSIYRIYSDYVERLR